MNVGVTYNIRMAIATFTKRTLLHHTYPHPHVVENRNACVIIITSVFCVNWGTFISVSLTDGFVFFSRRKIQRYQTGT